MRRMVPIALLLSLAFASVCLAGHNRWNWSPIEGELCTLDDINLDIDDGSVIMTHEYEDGEIEITENFELFVDGDRVKLDRDQQELVREYHTLVLDLKDEAIAIGLEGAKIGVQGAKVGLKAVGGVVKMIFTSYTEDDLDRDLDMATEEIEERAEELEDRAEIIEKMAEELEDLFYEMEETIPEIEHLEWH